MMEIKQQKKIFYLNIMQNRIMKMIQQKLYRDFKWHLDSRDLLIGLQNTLNSDHLFIVVTSRWYEDRRFSP